MKEIVLLDSGPLGKYSNPKSGKNNDLCKERVNVLLAKGVEVKVPEVADYEVRRELKLSLKQANPPAIVGGSWWGEQGRSFSEPPGMGA